MAAILQKRRMNRPSRKPDPVQSPGSKDGHGTHYQGSMYIAAEGDGQRERRNSQSSKRGSFKNAHMIRASFKLESQGDFDRVFRDKVWNQRDAHGWRTQYSLDQVLSPADKYEQKLVRSLCVIHGITILAVLVMMELGMDRDEMIWTTTAEVEMAKTFILFMSLIGTSVTFALRKHQSIEFGCSVFHPLWVLEYLVCLCCIPPYLMNGWWDETNGIAFFRCYIVYELLRTRHDIWKWRRFNLNDEGTPATVSTYFFIKFLMAQAPLVFFAYTCFMLLTFLAVMLDVFERHHQPESEFRLWIYYMVIVFTSVGLGDVYCTTWRGRMLTVVSAIAGFVFLSICVGFIFDMIELKDSENDQKEGFLNMQAIFEYRQLAASHIQKWWREILAQRSGKDKTEPSRGSLMKKVAQKFKRTHISDSVPFREAQAKIQDAMMMANRSSVNNGVTKNYAMLTRLSAEMALIDNKTNRLSRMLGTIMKAMDIEDKEATPGHGKGKIRNLGKTRLHQRAQRHSLSHDRPIRNSHIGALNAGPKPLVPGNHHHSATGTKPCYN